MAYNYLFKLLIIGDENTGKTNICNAFSGELFNPVYNETIGVEFSTCMSQIYDNILIKCQLWDTSGRRIFTPVIDSYFKGIAGIVLVYDISNELSFKRIDYWLEKIQNCKNKDDDVKILLLGNKSDKLNRVISYEEGVKKAEKNGLLFFETSAKENINLSMIKKEFCRTIFDSYDPNEPHSGIRLPAKYELDKPRDPDDTWADCCCCS